MKRMVLIAAASFALLSGIGLGAYFYLRPGKSLKATTSAHQSLHKSNVSTSGEARPKADASDLVADLGKVQDKIIYGDRAALADQGRLLAKISSTLRDLQKQDWEDYANVRAAFVYVLSGGDYSVLKSLIDSGALSEADKALAEGIMQFAGGHSSAARKMLSDVDPRSLDVSLVGPFALARASFYIAHDEKKAIGLLDEARLASPHTAIEEAAARREIPILVDTGDKPRAMMLMADYVRRFGKSIYAWKLFQDFAQAVAKHNDTDGSDAVDEIASITTTADRDARIKLFLNMASESLLHGKIVLAKAAASEALELKPESSQDVEKATLYKAAAAAPTGHAEDALKILNQLASDNLSDDDSEIHDAAGFIARAVSGEEQKNDARHDISPIASTDSARNSAKSLELPRVAGAIESADAALRHADMLISGNEQ